MPGMNRSHAWHEQRTPSKQERRTSNRLYSTCVPRWPLIDLHRLLIRWPQGSLLLPVRGDSMRGAGIHSGDLLLVERDPLPRDGAIVVAWLGDGFTVKRLRQRNGRWWLEAAHPAFSPWPLDQPDSVLWGRVIQVIRRL